MEIKASTRKGKKYMTKVENRWLHFGAKGYDQFKDSTGLGLFSHRDHMDEERKRRWYRRHKKNIEKAIKKRVITPVLLSAYYLW